jgi:anti-sigma B factor antagonist
MNDVTWGEEMLPNGVRQVALAGVLDSSVVVNRDDELFEFVAGRGGVVLVNLSGLGFLTSSGIRLFVRWAKALDEAGGRLHLAAPQPRVMSVLTIAGITTVIPVYQTLDEALAALSG